MSNELREAAAKIGRLEEQVEAHRRRLEDSRAEAADLRNANKVLSGVAGELDEANAALSEARTDLRLAQESNRSLQAQLAEAQAQLGAVAEELEEARKDREAFDRLVRS
jgi:DNA repair ATPase RecN